MKKLARLVLMGLLVVSSYMRPIVAVASVPTSLNIQGRLTDKDHVNRNGTFTLVFSLYSQSEGGSALWSKTYSGTNAVNVRNGNFSVKLGSPDGKDDAGKLLNNYLSDSDRWLGIRVQAEDGSLEPEMLPRQQLVSVPFAITSGNGIPVGTIIDWYRPSSVTAVPDSYQICDGSLVTDPMSPFYNKNTPNLIDKFTYGVSTSRIGETGGSNSVNLSHSHTVNAHNHSMSHTHAMSIKSTLKDKYSNSGNQVGGLGRGDTDGNDGRLLYNLVGLENWNVNWQGKNLAMALFSPYTVGTTDGSSISNTGDSSPNTNSQPSSSQDTRPAYVGVLKIIKIK